MKAITLLLLALSPLLKAQDNNKLVIQFVDDHYGEKVGTGICSELMYQAWAYVDSVNGFRDSVMDVVQLKDIKAGDLVMFESVLYSDGTFIDHHMAIVYRVSPGGIISVAQQNVGSVEEGTTIMYRGAMAPLVKDSRVSFDIIDTNRIVSGRLRFYRI